MAWVAVSIALLAVQQEESNSGTCKHSIERYVDTFRSVSWQVQQAVRPTCRELGSKYHGHGLACGKELAMCASMVLSPIGGSGRPSPGFVGNQLRGGLRHVFLFLMFALGEPGC